MIVPGVQPGTVYTRRNAMLTVILCVILQQDYSIAMEQYVNMYKSAIEASSRKVVHNNKEIVTNYSYRDDNFFKEQNSY
jgi:hypothetical protein